MCKYEYWTIFNQLMALDFTPSQSKDIKYPACLSPTPPPTLFTLPLFTTAPHFYSRLIWYKINVL